MRVVIITGSRKGTRRRDELYNEVIGSDLVIHGGARGVDAAADALARANGIHVAEIKALWGTYQKLAGPRRNSVLRAMARALHFGGMDVRFAAFPDPEHSPGTRDCIAQLRDARIEGTIYE